MHREKLSTKIIRMIISIRNSLEEIETEKISSYQECRRLEKLDKLFTSTLLYTLIDEIDL
tara:strand:+ start:2384 stop:2563 length:180 start_codon:yes stop_codon:yes gene_type:complete